MRFDIKGTYDREYIAKQIYNDLLNLDRHQGRPADKHRLKQAEELAYEMADKRRRLYVQNQVTLILVLLTFPVSIPLIIITFIVENIMYNYRKKVAEPCGHRIYCVLSFLFPQKVFELYFAQAIADMRDEVVRLEANGKIWQSRWISLVSHTGLLLSVAALLGTVVIKKIITIWKLI